MIELLEPWGLLPVAVPLLALCSMRLARWLFPLGGPDLVAASAVAGMALVHVDVAVLGVLQALTTHALLGLLALETAALVMLTRSLPWPRVRLTELWAALSLAVGAVVLAMTAARLLPVWQWDSVGYHLPFVNFVIQAQGFEGVPSDVRYVSTYPHDIELGMVALRLSLPDDRLVDLAQLPYGVAGALLTGAAARRLGAPVWASALAGALWLTLPCVFLQLPTNYVDVGTAAALLGALFFLVFGDPTNWRRLVPGALSLGLFLGSKPSAPLATALVLGFVSVVLARSGAWRKGLVAWALTLAFGAEMYVLMWARHGNPVWPVALRIGPLQLPGPLELKQLLSAGAALPSASGSTLERTLVSWLAIDTAPVFDMKVGGLGLVFLVALPFALLTLLRRPQLTTAVALTATLLVADPSMARYVLSFGAVVVALAVTVLPEGLSPRWRVVASVAGLALGVIQLGLAAPGLTGDGPSLGALLPMTDEQRRVAVGPHGRPTDYPALWDAVARHETVAFDADFEFPGFLWSPELRYRVLVVPPGLRDADALRAWADGHQVRALAVGPSTRALLQDDWREAFGCRSADCSVLLRDRTLVGSAELSR